MKLVRLKTPEELLASGWQQKYPGEWYYNTPKGGWSFGHDLLSWQDETFDEAEMLAKDYIFTAGTGARDRAWCKQMFIWEEPTPLPACTCGAEDLRLFAHHRWCNREKAKTA